MAQLTYQKIGSTLFIFMYDGAAKVVRHDSDPAWQPRSSESQVDPNREHPAVERVRRAKRAEHQAAKARLLGWKRAS